MTSAKLTSIALLAVCSISSQAATPIPSFEDFSSDLGVWEGFGSASHDPVTETGEIVRGFGGYQTSGLVLSEPMELDTGGYTDVTITFIASWDASMFGSYIAVEYSSDGGTTWTTLEEQIFNAAGVSFDVTVSSSLTDLAKFQITQGPSTNTGNGSIYIDDVSITGTIPEPGITSLVGLAGLLYLRRRRR